MLLSLWLVRRLAAPHARGVAQVQGVRQGGQEGVWAGRAQEDGAGCPDRNLLRQGRRRGGELREGGGREAGEGERWGVKEVKE